MSGARLNIIGLIILMAPALAVGVFSDWPGYRFNAEDTMGVIVSFKKVTDRVHLCDEKELAEFHAQAEKRLKHMRRANAECGSRERVPLQLVIWIDGALKAELEVIPAGIRRDGACYVYRRFILPAGEHEIKVAMKDSVGDGDEYDYEYKTTVNGQARRAVVISFESGKESFVIL
ncbi:MAG: hypothetical protein HY751_01515 [Nitrospinae bacterium]|nr:hypothetical protein [Nitrospinota bacterium]